MITLENVYKTGDDALGNVAELQLDDSFGLFKGFSDKLKFRTTNIEIPAFTKGTYTVSSKTQQFEKPNGKDETQKTFSSTFRVDKYYTVYKALLAWWQYICSSDTGAIAEDVGAISGTSNIRTDITVTMVDSNGNTTNEGFKFERAWIKELAGFSYDISSGDPLTCAITWSFVKMIPMF